MFEQAQKEFFRRYGQPTTSQDWANLAFWIEAWGVALESTATAAIKRETHELYINGDNFLCRHCGTRATSETIEDVDKRYCIWPNRSNSPNPLP
jgi:hypothetical protein